MGCGVCIVDADGPLALTGQIQLAGGGGVAARVNPCGALELLAVAGGVENAQTCGDVALVVTAGDEGVNHTVCGLELVVEQACGHIALDLLNVDGVLIIGDGLLVFLELTLGHLRFSSSDGCCGRSGSTCCRALRCGRCGRSLRGCRRGGRLSGSSRRARCRRRIGGGVRAATRNQHDNRQDDNNQQSQRTTDNTPNLGAGEQTLLLGVVLALTCGLGDVGVAQCHGCLVLIGHLTCVGLSVVRLTLVGVVLVLAALDVLTALRVLAVLETLTLETLALVLATLEVLALEALTLETISLVRLEAVRCLTRRDELCVLAGLHVLTGLFREVHGALGQVDGALGFGGVELNERGALDGVGSLFGGGGSLSCGSLSDRFSCRRCLGGNLGDGLNNNGLCNRFGNDRLRSGGLGNSGLGQCGLSNRSLNNVRLNGLLGSNLLSNNRLDNRRYGSLSSGLCNGSLFSCSLFNCSLFNCGRLGCENLLGQSGAGQRNLSQVTHRLGLGGFLSGLSLGSLNVRCLYLLRLNVGCLSLGHLSLGCCHLRNLDDLLTFEFSGELLQVNVLNGQRCRSLGGLLSLNSRLSNLLSGSRLSSRILGNQRLNSSLFNLNGFRLGLFDPQLPTFRNGTPRGVGAPRRSGGPSSRRSGPVGRRIEDECHKKAAFLVLKKHPGRAVISDYVYERIIATNYGIGSENEPREW
ncbi:hypothetical protein RMDY18_18970 [Rothia mucilaginosa DY-18]|uniref:Uncharacterized protein n=1 Tax=Rothia mucilaginosa (strain DY-18) TaxID=680646 RepID=D2NQ11_ROTMD|nr:hypothetical protein RMDY18_18970 [Rothia mucilaginosa DY-18]